jgi:hypothetical protein
VVVVHPHGVVFAQQRRELLGEQGIDAAIAGVGLAAVVDQVDAEVQQRPQRAVGEAVVVVGMVLLRQVDRDVADVAGMLLVQLSGSIGVDLAAPAEPQAAGFLECRLQRDGEAAGVGLVRDGDAVGDDDEAAHA